MITKMPIIEHVTAKIMAAMMDRWTYGCERFIKKSINDAMWFFPPIKIMNVH
jgi:hypothetical protein